MIRRAAALAAFVGIVAGLVSTVGTNETSRAATILAGRVHARFQPTTGKVFVLVMGSDARTGNPDGVNVDAIHIVGLNTDTMKGGILNFPRDSWVAMPGYRTGKINEALHAGGPLLVAKTLEKLTGIRLDYWVLVGFEGFQGILTELGNVRMRLPTDVYDQGGSGARLEAGTRELRPWEALAYARTRKAFAHGDIARTTNQGKLLIALLRKLRREVETHPATVIKWMAATRRHARLDMGADEMFRLGILASQVEPSRVGNVTVPASLGFVGAASVVFIAPEARSIYARFKRTGSL
ncbi:MAG: LCP family protein [Actinomycetota bacterium]